MTTDNNLSAKVPTIVLPQMVYRKIIHFVDKAAPNECSGMGVTRLVDDQIVVDDVVMVKQRNSSGSTDMEPDGIAKAMFDFREHDGTMNFWWHSHANMSVFWSGTDKDTISQISNGGMCVAAVFNKKREMKAAIGISTPFNIMIDNVEIRVIPMSVDEQTIKIWDDEFDGAVMKNTYQSHGSSVRSSSSLHYYGRTDYDESLDEERWIRDEGASYYRPKTTEEIAAIRERKRLMKETKTFPTSTTTSMTIPNIASGSSETTKTGGTATLPLFPPEKRQVVTPPTRGPLTVHNSNLIIRRWDFLEENSTDIIDYDQVNDMYQLENKVWVDAPAYINDYWRERYKVIDTTANEKGSLAQ